MSLHRCIAALVWCQVAAAQAELSQEAVDHLLLRLADSTTHSAAANELLQHGRAAVPALAKRLRAIGTEKPEAWVAPSLRVLARLGPDAAGALDDLLELAQQQVWHKDLVFDALGCIAPHLEQRAEVEAVLLEHLRALNDTALDRAVSIACVSRVGFDATVPTAQLLAGLQHDNPFVRQLVCESLVLRHRRGSMTEQDRAASCALLQKAMALDDSLHARLKYGRGTISVGVDPATVVRWASLALAVLAPELPASLAGHRQLLHDFDVGVQANAARDLGLRGIDAACAARELTAALDSDVLVAREAATALGLIGVDDLPVLAGLDAARRSRDTQLAARAAASLRQLAAAKK